MKPPIKVAKCGCFKDRDDYTINATACAVGHSDPHGERSDPEWLPDRVLYVIRKQTPGPLKRFFQYLDWGLIIVYLFGVVIGVLISILLL